MPEEQSNTTEKTEIRTTQAPTPTTAEKYILPIAIGLGLLLIVGGIALLGLNSSNKKTANLPDYTPIYITPQIGSTTPMPVASPMSSPVVAIPTETTSPSGQVATTAQSTGTTKGAQTVKAPVKSTTKAAANVAPLTKIASPQLPVYSPNSGLPEYTPKTEIPEYQPQYVEVQNQVQAQPSSNTTTTQPAPTAKQTITVTLSAAGQSYSVEVRKNATVLEVLQAAQSHGFQFKTEDFSGLGKKITEINGVRETTTQYWVYKINGKFAEKGISSQTINENDQIVWTLS